MPLTNDPATPPPSDSAADEVMDSQKLHQLLMQVSREEDSRVAERETAIAKNRARALQLLAVLEKTQGRSD
ncbi:MAG: hypothetical protein ACM3X0_10995 [Bacteroidota bacterium]